MAKIGSRVTSIAAVWCLAVIVAAQVRETAAVNCNPMELSPCLAAMTGSLPPSSQCCAKLKEQTPCFCGYIKNPALKPYIDSPAAKKVAGTCGVEDPTC